MPRWARVQSRLAEVVFTSLCNYIIRSVSKTLAHAVRPPCQSASVHPQFASETARRFFWQIFWGDIRRMSSFRNFGPGATLAIACSLALSFSFLPTAGHAYTDEEQQACQPDAFRLCSSEIPDVDRVTACMVAKKSQLSPECRRFFRPDPEPGPAAAASARPAGKPMSIKPATTRKPKPKARKTTKPAAT